MQVLVGLNKRDPNVFDMHRIQRESGEVALDTENPGAPLCIRPLCCALACVNLPSSFYARVSSVLLPMYVRPSLWAGNVKLID